MSQNIVSNLRNLIIIGSALTSGCVAVPRGPVVVTEPVLAPAPALVAPAVVVPPAPVVVPAPIMPIGPAFGPWHHHGPRGRW